jgi:hypothetical protein
MWRRIFKALVVFLIPAALFCLPSVATEYVKPLTTFLYDYTGIEEIDCIYCINLDIRADKWKKIEIFKEELVVNRVPAINGWKEISKNAQKIKSS